MSGRRTPRRSTRSPQPGSASKSAASLGAAARTIAAQAARPALPSQANELLPVHKGRLHSVKTQELKLEKLSILIARVKAPVPKGVSGHLIKRFDTDAVSASSFFRVAFPTSTAQEEEAEMGFLRSKYDTATAGAEHQGPEGRLTGTWSGSSPCQ